tara:strand:+ start:1700 stop:2116 length:417 start_codon:yes stop_codon:yes gene_type:complete
MSKFLDLIEENTPDLNLDEKIAAKRALQRCLMEKDIKCDVDQRSEDVMIHLPDGRIVKLEVKEFVEIEDNEAADGAAVNATDNMERIGMAVSAAEKIVGANNPRRGMQFQNPKKKIERSIGKVYSKVADQLNSVLKTI